MVNKACGMEYRNWKEAEQSAPMQRGTEKKEEGMEPHKELVIRKHDGVFVLYDEERMSH